MYAPIAERAIPYEHYMSRDSEHIYSTSRVTPRNAPTNTGRVATTDDELRQFSREQAVVSLSSTVDGDVRPSGPAAGLTRPSDKVRSSAEAGGDEGACITAGFDSNTLKRMLQTLPDVASPVDLMQEFEEEFADVVGPSTVPRNDAKPPSPPVNVPPPPPPLDDLPPSDVTSDRPRDVFPATTHGDAMTEVVTAPTSDVTNEKPEVENERAVLSGQSEQIAAAVQLTDVLLTTVTSSG